MTHALRPVVRDGLVEVCQDDQDRRAKRSVMTTLGKARHRQMLGLWIDADGRVEAALGAASTETLRRLADKIALEEFFDVCAAAGGGADGSSPATRG